MTEHYLPITEYSSKYRVSISTLRRRIKAEDVQFKFEEGKYLLFDQPLSAHQRVNRPSLKKSEESLMSASTGAVVHEQAPLLGQREHLSEDSVLSAANRLLTELKKAYSVILQEKEEQILHLREEVADLKTLVRVLEAENERLAKRN
jgi:hypothetical protein